MKKHIALGLVASTLFLAGCCTSHQSTAWEYTTVRDQIGLDTEVNKMVSSGWIVAGYSVSADSNKTPTAYYLMKRPKQ